MKGKDFNDQIFRTEKENITQLLKKYLSVILRDNRS